MAKKKFDPVGTELLDALDALASASEVKLAKLTRAWNAWMKARDKVKRARAKLAKYDRTQHEGGQQ